MKAWNHIVGEAWAITEPALQTILSIAERKNENIEAVAAKLGTRLENSHNVEVRDGIAIIPVTGPLFRYANLFTMISGATSYEILARDFTSALENPDIKGIILDIDSPGGEVNGCAEFANMIFDSRGTKPIIAYASGDAASGAYWIASACDEIAVSDTSALGSIGVVAVYSKRHDEDQEVTEIVSSQSPHKRLDPSNDKHKIRLQQRIDDLATVFIESVAKHRGVDPPKVTSEFGGGDVFIGKLAVKQGLADRVSSLEKVLSELSEKTTEAEIDNPTNTTTNMDPATERGSLFLDQEETSMPGNTDKQNAQNNDSKPTGTQSENAVDYSSLTVEIAKQHCPTLVSDLLAQGTIEGITQGIEQERSRIGAIISSDEANGREELAQHLAFKTDMNAETAVATLQASPKRENESSNTASEESSPGFEQVMAGIENPKIESGEGAGDPEQDEDALAQRIASL